MQKPIFRLKISRLPTKKYAVTFVNPLTGRIKTINFGARGYKDFTQTGNEERKRLYRLRHRNDNFNDLTTPGGWSWNLLWNKKSLYDSIRDIENNFDIKII